MSAFFLNHPKETDLALFAGGESGPFARWRIERHLESCKECEHTVADFFHLADELSPLAETPDVDWAAMQRNIQAGLAVASAEPEPRRGVPSWTWQLGAAAACALVAVAVWNVRPEAELASAPAAKQIAESEAFADMDFAGEDLIARSGAAPAASSAGRAEEARRVAAPARQLAQAPAEAEPMLEEKMLAKKKEASKPVALAERSDGLFSTDAAAPPPPAAAPAASAPAMEAEADQLAVNARQAGGRFATLAAGAAGRAESADARAQLVGFSVSPLPTANDGMQVAADGWVSVRSFNADGAMTIIDVYEPQ